MAPGDALSLYCYESSIRKRFIRKIVVMVLVDCAGTVGISCKKQVRAQIL